MRRASRAQFRSQYAYNVITEFYEMDVESLHNALLGRPWLHMMKAVLSIYHQLVRYPIPTRTADIKGDQAATRIISVVAQKKSGWKPKAARTVPEENLFREEAEANCY